MKRVLIIVENLPVPFDSRVWKEALALRENGYDVSVLCPRGKGFTKRFEILNQVRIYRHPAAKEGRGALGYIWEFTSALFWETLYSWWIYCRHGFDVLQACNPPDDIFLVALQFKALGVRFIFDHHDASPELYHSKYGRRNFFYRLLIWLERMTLRFSDVVMTTNGSYKELAIRRGKKSPDDVYVVRNGPDINTFKAVPPNLALKKGKQFLVGYVGNMDVQEGLDLLIDVASHIKSVGRTNVHFICVGGGPDLERLRKIVSERNLGDRFNFMGRVSNEDLIEILSTADVCVNPDTPCEMNDISTMIKIMEYMALGKPIVQFDLKEGRFSAMDASLYCADEEKVQGFAEKILWLLDSPVERARMGEFGRRRIETDLAWQYSVPNLLAAYEHALSRKSKMQEKGPGAVLHANMSRDPEEHFDAKQQEF